jgi:hypothetical protein
VWLLWRPRTEPAAGGHLKGELRQTRDSTLPRGALPPRLCRQTETREQESHAAGAGGGVVRPW